MEKDWSDILGDKLKDAREPLPEGDWELLEKKYLTRRRIQTVWSWASAVAVAAVVLLFFFTIRVEKGEIAADRFVAKAEIGVKKVWVVEPAEVPRKLARLENVSRRAMVVSENKESVKNMGEEVKSIQEIPVQMVETKPLDDEVKGKEVQADEEVDLKVYEEFWSEAETEVRSSGKLQVDLGVLGGGSFGNHSQTSQIFFSAGNISNQGTYGELTIIQPTAVSKPDVLLAATPSKTIYYAPFTVGLSVGLYFTERLGLSTGLNYSLYTNKELYNGSETISTVSYFGVPLRVDYRIVNMDKFNLYLGAGPLVEKSPSESKFLYSALLAAGMQFNFNRLVGIYIEPQFTYSLNKPIIDSYKTNSQSIFLIAAGLRFSLQ